CFRRAKPERTVCTAKNPGHEGPFTRKRKRNHVPHPDPTARESSQIYSRFSKSCRHRQPGRFNSKHPARQECGQGTREGALGWRPSHRWQRGIGRRVRRTNLGKGRREHRWPTWRRLGWRRNRRCRVLITLPTDRPYRVWRRRNGSGLVRRWRGGRCDHSRRVRCSGEGWSAYTSGKVGNKRAMNDDRTGPGLPPRPTPESGEPFPPHGLGWAGRDRTPEEDRSRELRLSHKPSPPEGRGPVLAWHKSNK